ncbi:hypothetical protein CHS0354_001895 [Potamilus streckersoni]|uniref:Uncharacterized protein n=1 Tax=Potamilus streckersoni TaxID=2493646 RepID=A0AAE0W3J7_9BIVA|nr:hypothetical protein CHS0354_001895 [Potamilus streckersoni]
MPTSLILKTSTILADRRNSKAELMLHGTKSRLDETQQKLHGKFENEMCHLKDELIHMKKQKIQYTSSNNSSKRSTPQSKVANLPDSESSSECDAKPVLRKTIDKASYAERAEEKRLSNLKRRFAAQINSGNSYNLTSRLPSRKEG